MGLLHCAAINLNSEDYKLNENLNSCPARLAVSALSSVSWDLAAGTQSRDNVAPAEEQQAISQIYSKHRRKIPAELCFEGNMTFPRWRLN